MELKEQEGVINVKADAGDKAVEVTYTDPATEETIIKILAEINYPVQI
jgi:hypothetical protein